MEKSLKESTQNYISKLNEFGLPYSFEILERNNKGEFENDGLYGYKDIPNVDKLILLTSADHIETQGDIKFLVVETYTYSDPAGFRFGVPSYSFVNDEIDGHDISCYQLNDDTPKTFKTIYEALADCVKTFEIDNLQKELSTDIFTECSLLLTEDNSVDNIGLAQLSLAESIFNNYNTYNKDLFECQYDIHPEEESKTRLIVSCKKYNDWTDVIYTGNPVTLGTQVSSFLSDNFTKYVSESTDLSKQYCEMELNNAHKVKPQIPKI